MTVEVGEIFLGLPKVQQGETCRAWMQRFYAMRKDDGPYPWDDPTNTFDWDQLADPSL